MTDEPQLAMPLEALGAVGAKSLRLFQLVRIGRHPSTVIPVGRADVTLLTGTGPEGGSNGVGKSMMASAIALANADADWLRGGSDTTPATFCSTTMPRRPTRSPMRRTASSSASTGGTANPEPPR